MHAATDIFEGEMLDSRHARLAYPLVHLFNPAMSLDAWLGFARRWARLPVERGGLMTIRDRRGYLHALFTYRVEHNLRFGRFLRVADIVMGQLPGQTLNLSLLNIASRLAATNACTVIVVEPAHHGTLPRIASDQETASFGYLIEPVSQAS